MARSHPEPHGGSPATSEVTETLREVGTNVRDAVGNVADTIKPRLRGWIHAGLAPLALAYGIVLVALTPAGAPRLSVAVFAVTTVLLFGTSAVYHRGTWSGRVAAVLRRLDHSNIFLVIAGTYTPLATLLLPASTARLLLIIVWAGAIAGILMRVLWLGAPRWLYVPIYVALGWVAVWFLPAFGRTGGPGIMWLVIAGGLAYTLGALVYGLKRPNPAPRWFGFHEIFHVGTMIGYVCHGIAVGIAALSLR
ncbi:PAQR family membrane homeostasis protein TrhA [Pseudactinotalea sp.]|uniref:PAQR family membrane homeostasis protein TrhA n=1 Tax=Pseudactinotalea sp. TaxID=1926260 RepID=UPI003B3A1BB1